MYVVMYAIGLIVLIAVFTANVPVTSVLSAVFFGIAVVFFIVLLRRNFGLSKHNFNHYDEKLLIIQNVQSGGVIRIHNVEGQSYDLDLKVINRNLYVEGDYSWYELECVNSNGEKFWIDVDDDDKLEVTIVIEKLKISDVKFSSSLDIIDDNEAGNVVYKGKIYDYKDSAEVLFYKHCDDKKSEQLYYWDFSNGKNTVSVERWGQKFEYYYSQIINPADIEVYRTKGEFK